MGLGGAMKAFVERKKRKKDEIKKEVPYYFNNFLETDSYFDTALLNSIVIEIARLVSCKIGIPNHELTWRHAIKFNST